jgi:hypothetical protein
MTIIQQTPIKDEGNAVEICLGSTFARQLGLADITEYDATTAIAASGDVDQSKQEEKGDKKKKKNNKKKKKKK